MNRTARNLMPLILTLVVILLDRITKRIVESTMQLGDSIPFVGGLIRWTYVHNYGMAFGMRLTGGAILGYVSILAVFVILYILMRTPPRNLVTRWILAAILGGAIGNTYDRLVYGFVVDFIDVDLPDFLMDRWYVFNVADAAVSVGVVLLVLMMLFTREQPENKPVAGLSRDQEFTGHDVAMFDSRSNGFPPISNESERAGSGLDSEQQREAQR